ncbi:MAG: class I SAM-dependent methyltransferase [Terriglobales bacterium]
MAATSHPAYPAPFDAVANRYDETFTTSRIGQAQRAAVSRELVKTFRPGHRILEVGCGTGVDACFLADRGVRVLATDASSRMIEVTARRIKERGLQQLVRPLALRAADIAGLPIPESFDGAFSNFGALNCVEDLGQLARGLARALKPGATALLCWMGPHCAWEMIWYLAQGRRGKAFRRLRRGGLTAAISDGASLRVHYPSVKLLANKFAPEFHLKSIKGIGVAIPPSYVEPWARRHPYLLNVCEQFDSWMAKCPGIRLLGDHVLVRLEREIGTQDRSAPPTASNSGQQCGQQRNDR